MSRAIAFMLPWGPSVNRMWRTPHSGPLAGRTMLSREGRAYRKACADAVLEQGVPRLHLLGKIAVEIVAYPPDRRRCDLDNRLKGTLDGLQHCGVIEDDFEIDELRITRGAIVPGGRIEIRIREIAGMPTATRELFERTDATA